jgi:hypothetical protein
MWTGWRQLERIAAPVETNNVCSFHAAANSIVTRSLVRCSLVSAFKIVLMSFELARGMKRAMRAAPVDSAELLKAT